MKTKGLLKYGYTAIALVFMLILLFPVYWMINTSLQAGASAAATLDFFPVNPDLSAYERAFSEQLRNMGTSLLVGVGCVVVTLIVATPAAYALASFRIKAGRVLQLVLVIAQMIPSIVIANSLYTMYVNVGLVNNVFGLILADATLSIPFAVLILQAFTRSIPGSLVEAARVDGASEFRAFWSIIIPVSKNGIITAALFAFLWAWGDFIFALTLTTTDTIRPITLGIYSYLSATVSDWGPVMATAVIACIPAIILLLSAQKYIAAGAVGGAVKA